MKQSKEALKNLLENIVSEACKVGERGLWFGIDELESYGKPISRIRVWSTLHYLPAGSPFNSTDPNESLWLFEEKLDQVTQEIQKALHLTQHIDIQFVAINANVHEGVIDIEKIYLSALMGKPQDINVQSADGITPLMYYAGIMPQNTIVDLLLRSGADPLLKDTQGRSALDYATMARPTEHILITSLITDAIAKVTGRDGA